MSSIDITGGSPICPTCGKRYPYFDPREIHGKPCFDCEERAKQPSLFEAHLPATRDASAEPVPTPEPTKRHANAPMSRAEIDARMASGATTGAPPPTVYALHDAEELSERARRARTQERVLARLRKGPAYNYELAEICLRYTGAMFYLRKAGARIEKDHVEGGVWRYTLVGDLPEGREETTESEDSGVTR